MKINRVAAGTQTNSSEHCGTVRRSVAITSRRFYPGRW